MAKKHADVLTEDLLNQIHTSFVNKISANKDNATDLLLSIPAEWQIPRELVSRKLEELFSQQWISGVWENYIDLLKSSLIIE